MATETEVQTVPDLRKLARLVARYGYPGQIIISVDSPEVVDAFAASVGEDVSEMPYGSGTLTSMTVREGAVTVTGQHVPELPGLSTRPPLRRPTSVSEELSGRDL